MKGEEANKSVLYRDIGDGYRRRLRGPNGETLAASAHGHEEKASCEEEMRAAMVDHPGAEVLDATVAGESGWPRGLPRRDKGCHRWSIGRATRRSTEARCP